MGNGNKDLIRVAVLDPFLNSYQVRFDTVPANKFLDFAYSKIKCDCVDAAAINYDNGLSVYFDDSFLFKQRLFIDEFGYYPVTQLPNANGGNMQIGGRMIFVQEIRGGLIDLDMDVFRDFIEKVKGFRLDEPVEVPMPKVTINEDKNENKNQPRL